MRRRWRRKQGAQSYSALMVDREGVKRTVREIAPVILAPMVGMNSVQRSIRRHWVLEAMRC